jgi:hypothetical protein
MLCGRGLTDISSAAIEAYDQIGQNGFGSQNGFVWKYMVSHQFSVAVVGHP